MITSFMPCENVILHVLINITLLLIMLPSRRISMDVCAAKEESMPTTFEIYGACCEKIEEFLKMVEVARYIKTRIKLNCKISSNDLSQKITCRI